MHIATSPGCSPPPHPMIASDSTRPASLPASREDREERESPSRCPSRDSRASVGSARCPSRESDLPPGLPVDAIAAALPTALQAHSAVAALLGVAPHRLMRGPISPLVSSSSSPPTHPLSSPPSSPTDNDGSALDFSKKTSSKSATMDPDALNLSKSESPEPDGGAPLDLSTSSRKRSHDDTPSPMHSPSPRPPSHKSARVSGPADFKNVVSPWTSPVVASHFPYFAAAVAAASGMSPKNSSPNAATAAATAAAMAMDPSLWNGKMKGGPPSDATKALEKMSELSKLGSDEMFRPLMPGAPGAPQGRHSAWQSHWLNKGADTAKDVLKCVWCKQSFPSLAALTTHMKEAKHCGVNVPVPPIQPPPPPSSSRDREREKERERERDRERERERDYPPTTPSPNHSGKSPSDMFMKESMPLPRKLVRGQDVWLGKGAEQTRQILKCMWCGQSFRSLAEMTQHMQQTQHYTNIISQEQIISWKTSDGDKPPGPGQSAPSGSSGPPSGGQPSTPNNAGASSHVSAVLTCKVCDQAFSSLKDLSNHMVKNQHYKEHIMRSITESGGRRRQTREKRKKSLPVRKLLELERAQNELKNGEAAMMGVKLPRDPRDLGLTTKISCEKCGDKIETAVFVDHVRLCVGGGLITPDQRNLLKNALLSSSVLSPESPSSLRDGRKSKDERPQLSPASDTPSSPKDAPKEGAKSDSPSVLCAIEKLIEKSFDSRARHGAGFPGPGGAPGAAMGSSILKRLGIDETVDYTKPLVDPQTMNLLRSYHQQQQMFHRRERSGSESSSMSERGGGSAGRPEALTPDRKSDQHTPRTTPDKRMSPPASKGESEDEEVPVKRERRDHDDDDHEEVNERVRVPSNASADIKREKDDDEDRESVASRASRSHKTPDRDVDDHHSEGRRSVGAESRGRSSVGPPSPAHSPRNSPRHTPLPAASPASSERSTPRSSSDRKSSLGALSSMFDSLSGSGAGEGGATGGKGSSHPLAALQKLCDKTETHRHARANANSSANAGSAGGGAAAASAVSVPPGTTPGAILAFSWACNDAIMTENSVMKCAFCDTPFISKGAYRHHLSKMHFVKDGAIPDPVAIKAQQAAQAAQAAAQPPTPGASSSGSSKTSNGSSATQGASSPGKSPQAPPAFEESPHSKFLKYTELAKQLSSKYV